MFVYVTFDQVWRGHSITWRVHSNTWRVHSITTNIIEIYRYGKLDLDVNRISTEIIEGEPNVEITLTRNSAKYHHNCSSKYRKREKPPFGADKNKIYRLRSQRTTAQIFFITVKTKMHWTNIPHRNWYRCTFPGGPDRWRTGETDHLGFAQPRRALAIHSDQCGPRVPSRSILGNPLCTGSF